MEEVKININHGQRAMIYGMAKDLGFDNDRLHELMAEWAGVTSLKGDACTQRQASIIIDCLKKIKSPEAKKERGTITDNQINAILGICSSYKWKRSRLLGFAAHTLKIDSIDSVDELNHDQASILIIGLKRMKYTTQQNTLIKSK